LSWLGSDPAIQAILKNMRFLLLDGPIKSGHDISEFLGCPDFCSSYPKVAPFFSAGAPLSAESIGCCLFRPFAA
jgi:hypothetical protein